MPRSKAKTLCEIRKTLGRTSAELANALGVSIKTIESYELGEKDVPSRVMIQLLVLLALFRQQSMVDAPCWEITNCKLEIREKCASFTVGRGQLCWYIGAKTCVQANPAAKDDILPCMSCEVVKRLLKGS